jgi:hypothetical protein
VPGAISLLCLPGEGVPCDGREARQRISSFTLQLWGVSEIGVAGVAGVGSTGPKG